MELQSWHYKEVNSVDNLSELGRTPKLQMRTQPQLTPDFSLVRD